jgi:hypothetical protein
MDHLTLEEIFISALGEEEESFEENIFLTDDVLNHLPGWAKEKLAKKTQINYSLIHLHRIFNNNKILISDYDLVTIGFDSNNVKTFKVFRILYAAETVLLGAHTIHFGNDIFNVTSLRALKKHFFDFNDVTSFERSTFLIHPTLKILIRLKNIRCMLQCGIRKIESAFTNPMRKININIKKPKTPGLKMLIIQRHLDPIINFYQKLYPNMTMIEVLNEMENQMMMFIDNERAQYMQLNE